MKEKLEVFETKEFKVNKMSPKLFNYKLYATSFFCLLALTLYLLNFLHFPALCLILFGALWNFFVDINTFLAFVLSILVGLLFSMLAIIDGLYVNAILYTLYYIPLQFIVWITNPKERDMSIKKDKKLSLNTIYYICIVFVLAFSVGFAIAININNEILLLFDAIAACMLGLSAFLQSYMYREYYVVRIVAVAMSIILWAVVYNVHVFSMGAIGMIILYSMYLVVDILSYIFWIKSSEAYDKEAVEELSEDGKKKLVQQKVEEYNKLLKEVQNGSGNDEGINA